MPLRLKQDKLDAAVKAVRELAQSLTNEQGLLVWHPLRTKGDRDVEAALCGFIAMSVFAAVMPEGWRELNMEIPMKEDVK